MTHSLNDICIWNHEIQFVLTVMKGWNIKEYGIKFLHILILLLIVLWHLHFCCNVKFPWLLILKILFNLFFHNQGKFRKVLTEESWPGHSLAVFSRSWCSFCLQKVPMEQKLILCLCLTNLFQLLMFIIKY